MVLAAAVFVASAAAGLAAYWNLHANDAVAQGVELREEGRPVSVGQEDEALSLLSSRVGFEVQPLEDVPSGYRLVFVDSTLGPPEALVPFPIAFLVYATEDSLNRIRVEQTGAPFAPPVGHGTKVATGTAEVQAWEEPTHVGVAYTVLTRTRGSLVLVSGPSQPSQSELLEMVKGLEP